MLQKSQAIHNCNQSVLAIFQDLNVTYSVLRFLTSFRKHPGTVISLPSASYFYNSTGLGWYFLCLEPASCLCERHCHRWVRYIDTAKITVLSLVWYRLVLIQYSCYRGLFVSGPASRLCNQYRHVWVRYIDTKKLRLRVCHCWYCLLIYKEYIILLRLW